MTVPSAPLPPPTLPHCYRHPDRETGRSCTRCGRPACSECLVAASVGSQCPECRKAARPDTRTRVRYWNARQPLLVTYALIGLNVAVFAWVMLGDASAFRSSSTTARQYDLGLSEYFLQQGEWYRMVTSGFLHFGVFHLFLNMLLLFQLGALLEPAIGRARFALLYFAALLGGAAGAMLLQPEAFHGGASGAVFGLMGAAVVGMYQRGVSPLRSGIGITLALNLMITFTIPGISIGGHLGGAVAGGLAALAVLAPSWKGVPHWLTYAAPVAVIVASVAVTVAVV